MFKQGEIINLGGNNNMGIGLPLPSFGTEKTTIIDGNTRTTESVTKLDPLGLITSKDKETTIVRNQSPQGNGGTTINIGQLNINNGGTQINNNNQAPGNANAQGFMQMLCQMMQLVQAMGEQGTNQQPQQQQGSFAFATAGSFMA